MAPKINSVAFMRLVRELNAIDKKYLMERDQEAKLAEMKSHAAKWFAQRGIDFTK